MPSQKWIFVTFKGGIMKNFGRLETQDQKRMVYGETQDKIFMIHVKNFFVRRNFL